MTNCTGYRDTTVYCYCYLSCWMYPNAGAIGSPRGELNSEIRQWRTLPLYLRLLILSTLRSQYGTLRIYGDKACISGVFLYTVYCTYTI